MKEEDCVGCSTYEHNNIKSRRVKCAWFNEKLICPCPTCLIKMMCRTECDLLIRHKEDAEIMRGYPTMKG